MKIVPVLDATSPYVTVGRHSIWAPALGVKLPFQNGGLVTKYGRDEAKWAVADSLPHELAILRALADLRMAPPIGDLVYVETLISEHPGAWHADPVGALGYEMADATKLPPGRLSLDAMRALPIAGSDGAWGDVGKAGNVVNGYLVDVRRTAWDMLRWTGDLPILPVTPPADPTLRADVHRLCQFPAGARAEAYQDFLLDGEWQRGQRRVVQRAALMGFDPRPGESVLEIGCQSGGFLQLAHLAKQCHGVTIGVEINADYVSCARRLARRAGHNICYRQMDAVRERDELVAWVRARCPQGLDHLLLLSMEKHLGTGALFDLLDTLRPRRAYVETNAVSNANPWKLRAEVEARGGRHVGDSQDRNLRRLYRIDRNDRSNRDDLGAQRRSMLTT